MSAFAVPFIPYGLEAKEKTASNLENSGQIDHKNDDCLFSTISNNPLYYSFIPDKHSNLTFKNLDAFAQTFDFNKSNIAF